MLRWWMISLILGDFRNANLNCPHSIKTAKYRSLLLRDKMDLYCIIENLASLIGKWIKGCLTIPSFSCFTLAGIHSSSTATLTFVSARFLVSLRTTGCLLNIFLFTTQCCALGDKRPWVWAHYKYFFLWIYHTCHAYVLQMWKNRASPSQKWRIRTYLSHLWKIRTNSSQVWQICSSFSHFVTDSFDCHIRTNLSHVWRIRTYLSYMWKNEFFTGVTNTCENFTRLK